MMSVTRRGTVGPGSGSGTGTSTSAPPPLPGTIPTSSRLSRFSKKLMKKEPPVPMNDLPPDAPPVECPPVYDVRSFIQHLTALFLLRI